MTSMPRLCRRKLFYCLMVYVKAWCVVAAHRRPLSHKGYNEYRSCAGAREKVGEQLALLRDAALLALRVAWG